MPFATIQVAPATPRLCRRPAPAGRRIKEGETPTLSSALTEAVSGVLAPPIVALPLGVVLSLALFRLSRASAFSVMPDAPSVSMARLAMSTLIRLGIAAAALAAYMTLAPSALIWFGAGLFAGFLALANYEMYRRGRVSRVKADHLVPMNKEG